MKREGYVFAAVVIGILAYQNRKINHLLELVEVVSIGTVKLLDESYQYEVDDVFEEMIETTLNDVDP